jgi:glycosyltransferase involved in cell wall biosynthesis
VRQRSDGLGNAFVEGLGHARGDVIALMDGDGSHMPKDLLSMLDEIGEYEMVIGSKLIRGWPNNGSLNRRMITLAFAWLTRSILWINIKDPMTGLTVAREDVFDKIELTPRGFKMVIDRDNI